MKGVKDTLSEPIEKSLLEFASYDSEAAEKTGYSDPKYFSKVFREATGLTPAEYRKNDQASR